MKSLGGPPGWNVAVDCGDALLRRSPTMLTRRDWLTRAGALTAGSLAWSTVASLLPWQRVGATPAPEVVLNAAPGGLQLADDGGPPLPVWAYNGSSPGPVLRYRVGDVARIRVRNQLTQPTTVHWHGMRVPNAMDGVPGISQAPILPGGEFLYEFAVRTPGTFWYHPHFQSAEQLDRGLYGAIVVEDAEPLPVDRDEVWVIDDWRLDQQGNVHESFANLHDASHGGRLGNVPSVNGRIAMPFEVRAGERIRLRLINVANARVFALRFSGHSPQVIALDGHAIAPHAPADDLVVLGPAMRVDLVIDCVATPGTRHTVRDSAYPRSPFDLLEIAYRDEPALSRPALPPISALPAPAFTEPDLAQATHHSLILEGGAMGGLREGQLRGQRLDMRQLARQGKVWALNGVVAADMQIEPWLRAKRGSTHVIQIANRTAFAHPMHLHGHPVQILSRDGRPSKVPSWRDTVLIAPREEVELAFVADNPGTWLMHCHIPEHMDAGMLGIVQVS